MTIWWLDLLHIRESVASNHCAGCCQSSLIIELLHGSTPEPLPLNNHISWLSPIQTLWHGDQRLLNHNCSLFSSPRVSQSQLFAYSLRILWAIKISHPRIFKVFLLYFLFRVLPSTLSLNLHWIEISLHVYRAMGKR
jgi:hypothetical protein